MKKLLYSLPEVFFICMAAFWIQDNYAANSVINYFAIAVIAVMVSQLIFSKRLVGIASGAALGLFSLFMVLAVRSEHNDSLPVLRKGLNFY